MLGNQEDAVAVVALDDGAQRCWDSDAAFAVDRLQRISSEQSPIGQSPFFPACAEAKLRRSPRRGFSRFVKIVRADDPASCEQRRIRGFHGSQRFLTGKTGI